jgi:hypothetical protein
LLYQSEISDEYATASYIDQPDQPATSLWANTTFKHNRKLLLCGEALDCAKFEVIFKSQIPYASAAGGSLYTSREDSDYMLEVALEVASCVFGKCGS